MRHWTLLKNIKMLHKIIKIDTIYLTITSSKKMKVYLVSMN